MGRRTGDNIVASALFTELYGADDIVNVTQWRGRVEIAYSIELSPDLGFRFARTVLDCRQLGDLVDCQFRRPGDQNIGACRTRRCQDISRITADSDLIENSAFARARDRMGNQRLAEERSDIFTRQTF